jgi:hypothetical protein
MTNAYLTTSFETRSVDPARAAFFRSQRDSSRLSAAEREARERLERHRREGEALNSLLREHGIIT